MNPTPPLLAIGKRPKAHLLLSASTFARGPADRAAPPSERQSTGMYAQEKAMSVRYRHAALNKPCNAIWHARSAAALRPSATCLAVWVALAPVAVQAVDGFTDLEGLNGGSRSSAFGVSADGSVVVGFATDGAAGNAFRAFRWTQAGGMVSLGTLNGGTSSLARAVSADGRVVVGLAPDGMASNADRAFLWTQAGGMVSLGTLNGGSVSEAKGVSADGSVVVGEAADGANADATRAFRWTQAGGMVSLGTLNGGSVSSATAVSADGSVVVGEAADGLAGGDSRAFRWTQTGGMVSLGVLAGGSTSRANAVSNDGSVVVGQSGTTAGPRAFRWTQADGMVNLGELNGGVGNVTESGGDAAFGVSADGKVVVGQAADGAAGDTPRAFRWTQAAGMQSVEQWLAANGVTVAGLETSRATATNVDGSVVVGTLTNNHAFLARITPSTASGVGSGLIDEPDFRRTLRAAASVSAAQAHAGADLILNSLHGNPLQGLPRAGGYNVWVAGDWGRQENVRGDGDIGAGEIGLGWGLDEHIAVKLAFGRSDSRQDGLYGGGSTQRGTYLAPELVAGLPGSPLRFSVSGYYAQGESNIRRGYLNAGTPVIAAGSPDYASWGARLRADWVNALTLFGTGLTPYLSFTHSRSRLDGYTEAGSGFPVRWEGRSDKSDIARLGIDAAHSLNNGIKLLARVEGAHRLEKKSSDSQGRLLGPGGFAFTLDGLDYRRDWLRLGLGAEGKVGPGTAAFMTNATTQTNGARYWASLSYRIDF